MRPAKIGPDLRLQQHGEATRRSHKSLRGYWRIFVKICLRNRILSLQQVAKNQMRLKLYDLLRRQNSVEATKIFTKILQCKGSVLSLQCVAATCCCNLSPSVYRTCFTRCYLTPTAKQIRWVIGWIIFSLYNTNVSTQSCSFE